jgi:carboxylesterase type B
MFSGGFIFGGSAAPQYNLSFIVQNSVSSGTPFIAVSINYRVSGWGFLWGDQVQSAGVTNLGLRDQRLALAWLQENIAAFGGDSTKVTIWGESAGGGSVSYQSLAFGGRDDHLFRGMIAQSGPPMTLAAYPLPRANAIYANITADTGCNQATDSLSCLRQLPFETLNAALNVTPPYNFAPAIDGDFLETFASIQLKNGQFTKTPFLLGANTDEGTLFELTGINTDTQFAGYVASLGASNSSIQEIMTLYPDVPALGLPATLPGRPNSIIGLQYKRISAFATDYAMLAGRRYANEAWTNYLVPSYAYRFNVIPNGATIVQGVTHYVEVAFVFDNVLGLGNSPNEFTGKPPSYPAVAALMSKSWASFIHDLDPNNHGSESSLSLQPDMSVFAPAYCWFASHPCLHIWLDQS